jgi:hypothetical protein
LKIWQRQQGRQNDWESKRPIAKEKKYLKNFKKNTLPLFKFQTLAGKRVGGEKAYCHFCGSEGLVVEKFPRRGYGYRWKEEQAKKNSISGSV